MQQVQGKDSEALWLIDFSAGTWCGPCTSLKPAVRRVAEEMHGFANVGIVDCDSHKALCEEQGVTGYPELRYYTAGGPRSGRPLDSKYRVSHDIKLSLWAQGAIAGLAAGRAEQKRNAVPSPGSYSEL
jgi:thiol-disulfide isomerase/thioredoxin